MVELIIIIVLFIIICGFWYFQNYNIVYTYKTLRFKRLPKSFDGYKILQLSDFHNNCFYKKNANLLERIKSINPDIIIITGDLFDRRRKNNSYGLSFAKQLIDLRAAPIYYITGNHEMKMSSLNSLMKSLEAMGIILLRNTTVLLNRQNEYITITGIDPNIKEMQRDKEMAVFDDIIKKISMQKRQDSFNILLSHRPDMFEVYAKNGFDLSFSGHAHGGQMRLPIIGGLYAPNQGVLPKYTAGEHRIGDSVIIISRGLGNSLFPLRVFNRPEVITVTLKN